MKIDLPNNIIGKLRTFEAVQEYSHAQRNAPWRPATLEKPPSDGLYLVIRVGMSGDIAYYRLGKWFTGFGHNNERPESEILYWMSVPPDPPELIEFEYGAWRFREALNHK